MLAQTLQTAAMSWKMCIVHHQKVMKGMCSGYLASSLKCKIERTECSYNMFNKSSIYIVRPVIRIHLFLHSA